MPDNSLLLDHCDIRRHARRLGRFESTSPFFHHVQKVTPFGMSYAPYRFPFLTAVLYWNSSTEIINEQVRIIALGSSTPQVDSHGTGVERLLLGRSKSRSSVPRRYRQVSLNLDSRNHHAQSIGCDHRGRFKGQGNPIRGRCRKARSLASINADCTGGAVGRIGKLNSLNL